MEDPEESSRDLTYRIAYGDAWRWREIKPYHATGKEASRSDRTRAELVATIVKRLGVVGAEDKEAFEEGVEDALEGRQPRW